MEPLSSHVVPISALSADDVKRMYDLMEQYYDNVSFSDFTRDLSKKSASIVLRDRARSQIEGFSTLQHVVVASEGRIRRGIFSGDTVVSKKYWGNRQLGKMFLRYFFLQKAKRPWSPLYWLLISKGYKTYLLMANNLNEYYPRCEEPTPHPKQKLLDAFYDALYPKQFQPSTGLIVPAGASCKLREGVAGPSEELIATNERVKFFVEKNPGWDQGNELACIAEVSFLSPFIYAAKSALQTTRPLFRARHWKLT